MHACMHERHTRSIRSCAQGGLFGSVGGFQGSGEGLLGGQGGVVGAGRVLGQLRAHRANAAHLAVREELRQPEDRQRIVLQRLAHLGQQRVLAGPRQHCAR